MASSLMFVLAEPKGSLGNIVSGMTLRRYERCKPSSKEDSAERVLTSRSFRKRSERGSGKRKEGLEVEESKV